MFDQLTENEAEVEDDKAYLQVANINPSIQAQLQINSHGLMGLGGISQQEMYGQGLTIDNFDGVDEFELLTGAIMFDGQFGPKKMKNQNKKAMKLSKLHKKYKIGLEKRIHTDPGYQCGTGLGDSDVDIGEDCGEEGPGPANYYRPNKQHFRNLHKYRERIQVLNEDLNVLIFDGEEEYDQISE